MHGQAIHVEVVIQLVQVCVGLIVCGVDSAWTQRGRRQGTVTC